MNKNTLIVSKSLRNFFDSLPEKKFNSKKITEYKENHLQAIEEFVQIYQEKILSDFEYCVYDACDVLAGKSSWFNFEKDWPKEFCKDFFEYFKVLNELLANWSPKFISEKIVKPNKSILPFIIDAYNIRLLFSNEVLIKEYAKYYLKQNKLVESGENV